MGPGGFGPRPIPPTGPGGFGPRPMPPTGPGGFMPPPTPPMGPGGFGPRPIPPTGPGGFIPLLPTIVLPPINGVTTDGRWGPQSWVILQRPPVPGPLPLPVLVLVPVRIRRVLREQSVRAPAIGRQLLR